MSGQNEHDEDPGNSKEKSKEVQEANKYHRITELKNVDYDSDGMVDVTFSDIPPEKKNNSILTLPTDWNYVPPKKKYE